MKIERANVEDFDEIIELFRKHSFALQERDWFDWKLQRAPYLPAKVYKLVENQKIGGTISLLPALFIYKGVRYTGVQAVDALMGESLRGKKLFNDVMVFTKNSAIEDNTKTEFKIGFPSISSSKKAFIKSGWTAIFQFSLRTYILNPKAIKARSFSAISATILSYFWPSVRFILFRGHCSDIHIEEVQRFNQDLNFLQPKEHVHGDRSAEFMNWRVADNPRDQLRSFTLKESGQICGYAICKDVGSSWELLEFRCIRFNRKYFASFLRYLHSSGHCGVLGVWLSGHFLEKQIFSRAATIERRTEATCFLAGHESLDLPSAPSYWSIGFLDSDW